MKLIKILALATAMATMATAQNTGAKQSEKGCNADPEPDRRLRVSLSRAASRRREPRLQSPRASGCYQVRRSPSGSKKRRAPARNGESVSPQKPAPTSSPSNLRQLAEKTKPDRRLQPVRSKLVPWLQSCCYQHSCTKPVARRTRLQSRQSHPRRVSRLPRRKTARAL